MHRFAIVALVALWAVPAAAQDLTGTWNYRTFINSDDFYGNNCVARTLRDSWRGVTDESGGGTVVLTMNGNYITGYEVEDDGSQGANISGIRNGHSVTFRMMYFPDTPIHTFDAPGCGQWQVTGYAVAGLAATMSGSHIHGHFVQTAFIRQNDRRQSYRVHAIFTMAKENR